MPRCKYLINFVPIDADSEQHMTETSQFLKKKIKKKLDDLIILFDNVHVELNKYLRKIK